MKTGRNYRTRRSPTVLLTKLTPPVIKGKVIERNRLVELLDAAREQNIVLLTADAGYGKTTLISQWIGRGRFPHIYYGLDEEDGNFESFMGHLIAGFDRFDPGLACRTKELLEQDRSEATMDAVVGTLINELEEKCPEGFFLILDDFHAVSESSLVFKAVGHFLDHQPARVRCCIASRVVPPFPGLTRWRSKQRVFELERNDLRFLEGEVKELINNAYDMMVPGAEMQRIVEFTEGWITGIQLILQSTGRHRAAVKDTLNGFLEARRPLFDYFADEVLSSEPPAVHDFMTRCSLLEHLTPEACDAVLDLTDSRRRLAELERRHLFLYRVDDDGYRFHHLFREFLMKRLGQSGRLRPLAVRAARYYLKHYRYDQAVRHFLQAKSYRPAGRAILRAVLGDAAYRLSGEIDAARLRVYLDELPESVTGSLPQLLVIKGTLRRETGEHDAAREYYARAEEASRRTGDATARAYSLAENALLDWLHGEYETALDALKKAQRACPRRELRIRLHILNLLGLVWQDKSDLAMARRYLMRSRKLADATGIRYNRIVLDSNIATILLRQGEIGRAYGLCRTLIARLDDRYYYKVGVVYANAARAALDYGDIDWAESCLERGWRICHQFEDNVSFGTLNHCFGLLCLHKQQWDRAFAHFQKASEIFSILKWKRMESSVLRNIGTGYRLAGDLQKCRESIDRAGAMLRGLGSEKPVYATFLLADRALVEADLGMRAAARRTIDKCRRQARAIDWQLGRFYWLLVNARLSLSGARRRPALTRRYADALITYAEKIGCRGILAVELRHLPELASFLRRVTDHGAYLDRLHARYAIEPSALNVRLCGGLALTDRNSRPVAVAWPTEKTKSLFAFLIMNRHRGLSRERVIDALWSEMDRKKAQENLRTTAYRMRRAVGRTGIVDRAKDSAFSIDKARYELLPNVAIDSDLDEFDSLLKQAEICRSNGERMKHLSRAIAITNDGLLPDIYDRWVDDQRAILRERRLGVLQRIIRIAGEENDDLACVDYCRRYLAAEPLSEETARICMKSLKRMGRLSEIKEIFTGLEEALDREVGRKPGSDTRTLYRELMEQPS